MSRFILSIATLLVAASTIACEETIDFDLGQVEPQYVVNGSLTSFDTTHWVFVSQARPFDGEGTPTVQDATVTVTDDEGTLYTYTYDSESGRYLSDTRFAGVPGRTYTLQVQADGNVFTATEPMIEVGSVDSMYAVLDPDADVDDNNPDDFWSNMDYDVYMDASDIPGQRDYFVFNIFRNDSLLTDDGTGVWYGDDEFINSDIRGIDVGFAYAFGQTARFEIMSVSRRTYLYYQDLDFNLNNDGGMFSPPPANPRTNIEGGALGVWTVADVTFKEIVINEDTILDEVPGPGR